MTFDEAHSKMLDDSPQWNRYLRSIPPALLRYYYESGRMDWSRRKPFKRKPRQKKIIKLTYAQKWSQAYESVSEMP